MDVLEHATKHLSLSLSFAYTLPFASGTLIPLFALSFDRNNNGSACLSVCLVISYLFFLNLPCLLYLPFLWITPTVPQTKITPLKRTTGFYFFHSKEPRKKNPALHSFTLLPNSSLSSSLSGIPPPLPLDLIPSSSPRKVFYIDACTRACIHVTYVQKKNQR
ncbi:MAG: hypothetical protein J3R72DRAFT_239117 [Linnemannia gamsii]|nr:MAG: hypothetical protein J3R72DRAFT_239117 [Linnemannia gamsii]